MLVRVFLRLFCRLFLELLQIAFDSGELKLFTTLERLRGRREFISYLQPVSKSEWVVYAKSPLAGPEKLLDYTGPDTHRAAISNNHLLDTCTGELSSP